MMRLEKDLVEVVALLGVVKVERAETLLQGPSKATKVKPRSMMNMSDGLKTSTRFGCGK